MIASGESLLVNLAGRMLQPVMKAWATYESGFIESGLWRERLLHVYSHEKRARTSHGLKAYAAFVQTARARGLKPPPPLEPTE